MKIHNLKRVTENKKPRLIGRGGKRGKTSGRGGKGQTARAGHKARPEMRDTIKRMPKLRGYAFNTIQKKPVVINVGVLEVFANGDSVTPATLVKREIVEMTKGGNPRIKILSMGEVTKKLNVSGCLISAGAKAKIEKAGGSIK
ncbi:MAG: uL15 family ribosomal protein [Candidatus Paceibacterota bacterium]|jgi:large subunit ribosomal protein L15